MRVEVLQARHPLGHKRVGDVIEDMPEGQANDLKRRGIVAPVNRMVDTGRQAFVKGKRR